MSSRVTSASLLEEASLLELTFPLTQQVWGTVLEEVLWPAARSSQTSPSRHCHSRVGLAVPALWVIHQSSELEVPLQLVPVRRYSLDCLLRFRLYPPLTKQKTELKAVALKMSLHPSQSRR